ncbi:MAG: chemotaxis protein CheW [Ruminococcus sp.]|nr:chemotaxis protein CheW [Ruminococcus sp.]MCM1381555.1 chemotaxis protein CheW [Muribaculaceae bacterium]MCM1479374.1 chemotaxis protein CheW [Muribaculaceae bacterium]
MEENSAVALAEESALGDGLEVLSFGINDVVYAIDIRYVKEIIAVEQITVVPKIPGYIKGVINIRGKVVPVISVRARFGLEEIPYDDRTCIIVLEFEDGEQVGIIVDRVHEVIAAKAGSISKPPESKNVNANKYIKSIINLEDGKRLLISCDKLINDDRGVS